MATKHLKGLTIQIGADTTGLDKALSGIDKKSRSLSSELGQINKLLKLDPTNTELLAQKQKVLADAISNTESRLDTLREAEKQVQAQFERGEVSEEQYRALQREIIATEGVLDKYKNAAKETAEAAEELADAAGKSADELEEEKRKAEDADKATDDLGDTLSSVAKTGFTALIGAATAAVTAIVGLAESTREYRTEMGKLDTAFQDSGHSGKTAYNTYADLQGILGETDQAVEAASHLAKLADTEEELADWTDILTGVYAKCGASIPVEGLAEAANETAKVGQVTGPLADALNWAAAEGETFGLVLKENIEFTELSKKELEDLTDAQREEYDARKAQYDAIEEYNQSIEEAVSAEDKFNLALAECSDEQERQQLITQTLTKIYKGAADQYKKTNKEVIAANKANEKMSRNLAEMGETAEPLVTDIKELGSAVLEDMQGPFKTVVNFIRQKVLPGLTSIGRWVKENKPIIITAAAGVTAALVAHKIATLASEAASKGLTIATVAQTAAQKALNAVMTAGPWGLAATAITGVATALIAHAIASKDAKDAVDVLTKEERELMAAADEAARAFRDQQKATNETLGGINAQMGHVQNLAKELQGLADASGRVQEKDRARAEFILGQLNEALGTEYQMVDGIIQQYDTLRSSIDQVIQSKTANSLLEAANADYVAAIQAESDALRNWVLKEEDHKEQLVKVKEAEEEYLGWKEAYDDAIAKGDFKAAQAAQANLAAKERSLKKEQDILDKKKTAYDQAALDYGNYHLTILNYEEAETAALQGNYDRAIEILKGKSQTYHEYADEVDAATAEAVDALFKEAVDAGIAAQRTKENFEKGVDGYTQKMVDEAERSYQDTLDAYADAYADAQGVGEDLGSGLEDGMENKRSGLVSKAKSLVSGILSAMRKEADSHSPARKTIDFGEDVGEGAEIGIDNKTKDVAQAGKRQAAALLDAYREQEVEGQATLTGIAQRRAERQTADSLTAASANAPILGKILEAIKAGQVLLLDGDTLVGATEGRMDSALGRRRVLVERGAI